MKKILLLIAFGLLANGLWAQNNKGPILFTGALTDQKTDPADGSTYTIQVGLPFVAPAKDANFIGNDYAYIRFPWDILYLYDTFSEEEESFDISKGFFGDKILLKWVLRSNYDIISRIEISRREYTSASNLINWVKLASVSKDVTEYEDKYVDGGTLYEYKVEAVGVDGDAYLQKYITGVGFRSPTAVVTGNVNYDGGSPVPDVTVTANADGANVNLGAAINIKSGGSLDILRLNKPIDKAATLQAWIKPENPNTAFSAFTLKNEGNLKTVLVEHLEASNSIEVTVDDAVFSIKDFYPTGVINARGDDELVAISNFSSNYIHISVVLENGAVPKLFINGRQMDAAYETLVKKIEGANQNGVITKLYETFGVVVPTKTIDLVTNVNLDLWNTVLIGGNGNAFFDEIRIWKAALSNAKIRTDYKRYISGNDSRLVSYIRAEEGLGNFAYDYSRNGFNYNKNHGALVNTSGTNNVLWVSGAGNIPTASQLGVLGVTDANGNYEISAIPYSGTGESFTITPSYGLHKFEPSQKIVYLGEGSTVVNDVNFKDKSSFIFKGKVLYDTRGVFLPSVTSVPNVNVQGITQDGYNTYLDAVSGKSYAKGEYWLDDNATVDNKDDVFKEYAPIYLEGANVYIDGQIVLDQNNIPVETDGYGSFSINVPIGNHYITVKKDGHVFEYNGRYPEASTNPDNNFVEFFQDSENQVVFIDKTRVTVVGRVVGGTVEAQKPIGFGHNGLFKKDIDNNGTPETLTISSINNIGVANITLGYIPPGSTNGSLPSTEFNFLTHIETGEYRVDVMPLKYQLAQTSGLKIVKNNDNIELLDSDLDLVFSEVNDVTFPEFEYPDGTVETGEPYNYEKSFTYRSTPVLRVISQSSEKEIDVDGQMISTVGFTYPVYKQYNLYEIVLQSFEKYTNYDGVQAQEVTVPVTDGELSITNNLAFTNNESYERDAKDASIINYIFRAGKLNISGDFANTLDIKYVLNNIPYEVENDYAKKGIVLGGASDGSQTFVTASPDVPDIILRDPPGSNSFASIESGQSISFTTSNSYKDESGDFVGVDFALGPDLELTFGTPPSPSLNIDITADVSTGISTSTSITNGSSITKTYTFNQTISTSDDPLYVGADGDLYIGQSKNYFYGSFNKIEPSTTIPTKNVEGVLVDMTDDEYVNISANPSLPLYISAQKRISFKEEPLNTFFIYSQKQIINYLIPQLQLLAVNAITLAEKNADPVKKDKPGILTREQYLDQVSLWRKLILENERSKYLVKNDRENAKQSLVTVVDDFRIELEDAFSNGDSGTTDSRIYDVLIDKTEVNDKVAALLNSNFENNFSFDAGVGEFTRSVETTVVAAKSTEFNLYVNESIATALGVTFNGVGMVVSASGYSEKDINSALSTEEQTTTTISYTLKDNDKANLLSVDVVNLFDGYGPIFSTIGGVTSCPYEGAERSVFYNHADYDAQATLIVALPEEKQEELNYATQRAEVPEILVTVASVSNVPESSKAEFDLIIKNNSASETDQYFTLYVDNLTNPDNALINIEQNGTVVFVPYGQSVPYKMTLGKSVSDVYDYENIRVVLESRCDATVYSDVFVTAKFAPSCTEVALKAPLDNWVFNNRAAFNTDGTINKLPVEITGFNVAFNSFKKIDLEYRLASSSTWTKLQTYYGSQEEFEAAANAGEQAITFIENTDKPSFAFDIVGLSLPDGNYQLRARSTCTNGTQFVSEVITGRVDLNAPVRFGTPLPTDGILGAGEDLRVSFNEDIFFNSAGSKIEITGATNQLLINNNVSLYFEGANNTVSIEKPRIVTGDFSLEFWMKNATVALNATIFSQQEGLNIGIVNGEMAATLGGLTAKGPIASDNLFHHYTITFNNDTGSLSIYADDKEIGGETGLNTIQFTNSNALIIGGNTFVGNIHDLRLWSKSLTLANAYANIYTKIIGNEANLLGYWPMDEGRGNIAYDLASYKHASVNTNWDIKPKGTSYEFANNHYLELDNVGSVQLTKNMDATISFWLKTNTAQEATVFSNGKGDGTDPVQSNGLTNKWAINMNNTGNLTFESEGVSYQLTTKSVADNSWHHVALLLNRSGLLRTYVDAKQVSSNPVSAIGGFSGNKVWLGARGHIDLANIETFDRHFTGKIDEFRLWNSVRNLDQISRDRFNEVNNQSTGLMLYATMNEPDPTNAKGPRYFHASTGPDNLPSDAKLVNGTLSYTNDAPAIKPARALINFQVNHVINQDDMIIDPVISDWAVLEGQILDITVSGMFDSANNQQESPITWTAYVQKNEVSWFVDGFTEVVDLVKYNGDAQTFEITLINSGGTSQPFAITNLPSWMQLSSSSGSLSPDSKKIITVSIDNELPAGIYNETLFLETDYGFNQKLPITLRVLEKEPNWVVNANDYAYSSNIVGRIKVDGIFSDDIYDRIGVFYNDEVRGVANLVYNASYQQHYIFLTIYSNNPSGEALDFRIWDATKGKVLQSTIDGALSIPFISNDIQGNLINPILFENTSAVEQDLLFNRGWTWVSFNVADDNFNDINTLTSNMVLATDDRILSNVPSQLETYTDGFGWSGTVSVQGGLSVNKMYKVFLNNQQSLKIKGTPVNINTWNFPVTLDWNWLPYTLPANMAINEAMSLYQATPGDVIKSQNLFAIYDEFNGWIGSLSYLEDSKGYMLKSGLGQELQYPKNLGNLNKNANQKTVEFKQEKIASEFTKYANNMNAIVLLPDGYNELLVYDLEHTLKGKSKKAVYGNKELSFITVYGEGNEELEFYVKNDSEIKPTSKKINFSKDAILGTFDNPIDLRENNTDMGLYPNPFSDAFSFSIKANKSQTAVVKIYSVTGQLVYNKNFKVSEGLNTISVQPEISSGIYLMHFITDEDFVINKIIKN
ncbi:MAG: T9SS type A sorting domain-containing protein [Flavobacteriaceae bacterium]|nr:T9SS type A sorting domain-containing protein [Flavobacteriaceae bacterium]